MCMEVKMYMRRRINISLDPETAKYLKELAEQSHMNMSQWITQAIWEKSSKNKDKENGQKRKSIRNG